MSSAAKKAGFVALVAFVLTGCATNKSPVLNSADIQQTNFAKDFKTGKACANYLLGFIGPFGDASLVDAAKNGGLSKVEVVDYRSAFYVVVSRNCVIAYGEDSK